MVSALESGGTAVGCGVTPSVESGITGFGTGPVG